MDNLDIGTLVSKAHVIVGPPDFAWGINTSTSLYDIVEDVYNKASPSFVPDPTVQFYRDIWPVLSGTYNMSWVNKDAFQGHGKSFHAATISLHVIHSVL